ncbi:hypothetical protein FWP56_22295 [Vibrio vulnificus]|nr:hypothetical protein [Vibrio vulnificus]HAS6309276.1 hypothetical protein [Vibrio vulnificus]HDY7581022.1 hypothetical protein [Vibrio vulnificus]
MINDLSTSDVIAISAVLISIISLVSTALQARANKEHNMLSVRPSLNLNWELSDSNKISCSVSNCGIGPAYLSSLYFNTSDVRIQVKSYRDFIRFFSEHVSREFEQEHGVRFGVKYGGFDEQAVIPSGGAQFMMEFYNDSSLNHADVFKYIKELQLEISYKCAYGQKYNYKSTSIQKLLELP